MPWQGIDRFDDIGEDIGTYAPKSGRTVIPGGDPHSRAEQHGLIADAGYAYPEHMDDRERSGVKGGPPGKGSRC